MMNIKLHTFEGPLDLLLHLIDKAEVDIYEISVSEITEQYMEYIRKMQQLELEIASEFLVMAAKLLAMKSRMLLPKKEELEPLLGEEIDEIDPRVELIQRLIEYKRFKNVAEQLREKEVLRSQVYTRPPEKIVSAVEKEEPNPVANVSLFDLLDAFEAVFEEKSHSSLSTIDREEISIDQRMAEMTSFIEYRGSITFLELFEDGWNKDYLIVTFLSLLELMKKKIVMCHQDALFSNIMISPYSEATQIEPE